MNNIKSGNFFSAFFEKVPSAGGPSAYLTGSLLLIKKKELKRES